MGTGVMMAVGFILVMAAIITILVMTARYDENDKIYDSKLLKIILPGMTIIGGILLIGGALNLPPTPVYEYNVRVHYLDGFSKTVSFESTDDPYIYSYKGEYKFCGGRSRIPGVIRFEVLSKTEKKE